MTVNDIINTLENRNDFRFIIQDGGNYGIYFENYYDIPTNYLNTNIKQFYIDREEIELSIDNYL